MYQEKLGADIESARARFSELKASGKYQYLVLIADSREGRFYIEDEVPLIRPFEEIVESYGS